jgi:endoribonuclease Dicer
MAGGGGGGVTYWYDACEDDDDGDGGASLLCGIDFAASADFDPGLMPSLDSGVDDGFVAEIDRILESINAETAPAPPQPQPPPPSAPLASPPQPPTQQQREAAVPDNALAVAGSGQRTQAIEPRKEARREPHGSSANGGGDCRGGKRPRLVSGADRGPGPRPDPRRRPMLPPPPSRRRDDRRGFDRPHKRDRDGRSGHHDHNRREARGFWERDRGGKMVFRAGTWDQEESGREAKRARAAHGAVEKQADADKSAHKEKPVTEEHARQYQLEVLEQAKSRNTIAFLETGAGKTLIAVLLIKSMCDKMLKENKKILAIFLVPKVPLVYQVHYKL